MTKKTWLILILIALSLCALSAMCAGAALISRRLISSSADRDTRPRLAQSATGQPESRPLGGVLRLAGGLPPTLDPALVQDSTSAEYIVHLFSGLVRLNSELEIVPDLAERWELSEDGRVYTFYLRPEASFADGRLIAAEDLVYSLERACSPALGSTVAETYLGDIEGVSEYIAGQTQAIAGLVIVDPQTLQIKIDAPKAYFLAKLTYPTAYAVDRVQIEREGDRWISGPNGSGPFILDELTQDKIVLARNERYYGQLAALERVEYLLSGGYPITMYENDQLDVADVPPGEVVRITDPDNPLSREYRVTPVLSVQYWAFNVDEPPFDDPAVRQAFVHAIDREKLTRLVLQDTASPARGILPPGIPDFDEAFQGLSYDPDKARALLASSRYGQEGAMPRIVLTVSGTSGYMAPTTRALRSMIEDNLGIEIQVEQVEWSYFLRDLNERRFQISSSGWMADYPDSQNFLDLLFHSRSGQNHSGYANSQVDSLLEQARIETDPQQRTVLYRQAERLIIDDAPWIPLTHGVAFSLVKPNVQGYSSGASLYPWLMDVYLEP